MSFLFWGTASCRSHFIIIIMMICCNPPLLLVSPCSSLLWKLLLPLVFLCVLLIAVLVLLVLAVRLWLQSNRNVRRARDNRPTVAFFHPYCNAGGGGERVLWCAIRSLQSR